MLKYLFRRLLAAVVALAAIMTLAFWVLRLMPGSIYDDPNLPPEVIALLEQRAHLDRPIWVQYSYFLKGVLLEGDWGVSVKVEPGVPAFQVLAGRIPVSLRLNLTAFLIALPIGLAAGAVAALRKGKLTDLVISTGVVIFISVPSFVVSALLQYCLAFRLGWFPILYEPGAGALRHMWSMVLPMIALALGPVATITRYLRGELIEVLNSPYMDLARAKGLNRRQAVVRHGLRNASVPVVTVVLPMFANVLGGSMVIERLYAIPGVGGIMIRAINAGDHSLTLAALIFYALVAILTGLVIDLVYGLLDPRVRVGVRYDG